MPSCNYRTFWVRLCLTHVWPLTGQTSRFRPKRWPCWWRCCRLLGTQTDRCCCSFKKKNQLPLFYSVQTDKHACMYGIEFEGLPVSATSCAYMIPVSLTLYCVALMLYWEASGWKWLISLILCPYPDWPTDSWSFSLPLFCSRPLLLLYVHSRFLHSALLRMSLGLFLFLVHRLPLFNQQIHPSYQQVRPEQSQVGLLGACTNMWCSRGQSLSH